MSWLKSQGGVYRSSLLNRFRWLDHGFGTATCADWPNLSQLVLLKQIHSDTVVTVDDRTGTIGEGDALITDRPGFLVGVRTADCVPILLADRRNRAVAAVHAGWRGTASAILIRTLESMKSQFGTHAADVYAAIGPCIGACCYEVGAEVSSQFEEWMPELPRGVKQHLDLVEANRRQLRRSGVINKRIDASGLCTFCSGEKLHSHRRDAERSGRMVSCIGVLRHPQNTKSAV